MNLSNRLKPIADSIAGFDTMADIGTDHAYLPIYLIKSKKIKKAIASDVNEGPVKIAQSRVNRYNLSDYIEIRKGDGLKVLSAGEAEAIVIAGMGGILISDILENDCNIAKTAKILVLQPMRDADKVRRWLCNNNFDIFNEDLVKDDNKIYEIIWAKPSIEKAAFDDALMLIGKQIIDKKHPLLTELLNKKISELEKIVSEVSEINTEGSKERLNECNRLLKYYKTLKAL